MTIDAAYKQAIKKLDKIDFIDNPSLEAEILILHILNLSKSDLLLSKNDKTISKKDYKKLTDFVKKRQKGRSIADITHVKAFYNHDFYVNKNCLIPRPETEQIIEIIEKNYQKKDELSVLEIGIGSGAISISLIKLFSKFNIDALDISKKALKVAEKNIKIICDESEIKRINLIKTDFFSYVPEKKYNLIISNPPYIPTKIVAKISKNNIVNDPKIALDGGLDGLKFLNEFKNFMINFLSSNGELIFEHGFDQKKAIEKIFSGDVFNLKFYTDLSGKDRICSVTYQVK